MIDKLISSYSAFTTLFRILVENFSGSYHRIVSGYDVKALLLFYAQFILLIMFLNTMLMPQEDTPDHMTSFNEVWFISGTIFLFLEILIFTGLFRGFLALLSVEARFAQLFKYFTCLFIFTGIVTLTISFAIDLYLYSVTDHFETFATYEGVMTDRSDLAFYLNEFQGLVIPALTVAFYLAVVYFAIYRSRWVPVFFAVFIALQIFVINPGLNHVWLGFLQKRFHDPGTPGLSEMDAFLKDFDSKTLGGTRSEE